MTLCEYYQKHRNVRELECMMYQANNICLLYSIYMLLAAIWALFLSQYCTYFIGHEMQFALLV